MRRHATVRGASGVGVGSLRVSSFSGGPLSSVVGGSASAAGGGALAGHRRADRRRAPPVRAHLRDRHLLERIPRLRRRLRAGGRVLGEEPLDPAAHRRVAGLDERRERRRARVDVGVEQPDRRVRDERRAAGEQLVGDHAERVEVRVRTERLVGGLLGRHVGRRADRHARRGQALRQRVVGARDPEVGDLRRCPRRVSSTFSGLRSRCAMPRRSACPSPASTPSTTPQTCGRSSRPDELPQRAARRRTPSRCRGRRRARRSRTA